MCKAQCWAGGDRCVDMNAGRAAARERTPGHGNTGTLTSFPKGCGMLKIMKLTLQQSPGSYPSSWSQSFKPLPLSWPLLAVP